jgi:sugar phosphate permease
MQGLVEATGAALAPFLAGLVADRASLGTAFIVVVAGAAMCWTPFYLIALASISRDLEQTRSQLRARSRS